MKKYVSTTYTGSDYITAGKLYEVALITYGLFRFLNEEGDEVITDLKDCVHIEGGSWDTHNVGTLKEIGATIGSLVGNTIDQKTIVVDYVDFRCRRADCYYLISQSSSEGEAQ